MNEASDLGPQLETTTFQCPGLDFSLAINWKSGSPSGCHHHSDECRCQEADLKRGNIFHGELNSTHPHHLKELLESLAGDAKASFQTKQPNRRLREETYHNAQNKQPQLPSLPFTKVEVIDMRVLEKQRQIGLLNVHVLENSVPALSVENVKNDFVRLDSNQWENMMSLLQKIPGCKNCGSGDLHFTPQTGESKIVSSFGGHKDKIHFPYVIFLTLIGDFWTLVAVPSDSPDAMEPDDGLEEMRKDFEREGGEFMFNKKRCRGSDVDKYLESFKRDAEREMSVADATVKLYRCRRGVVLKFPASEYYHATVSLPSVNTTGRLLGALVEVTGDYRK